MAGVSCLPRCRMSWKYRISGGPSRFRRHKRSWAMRGSAHRRDTADSPCPSSTARSTCLLYTSHRYPNRDSSLRLAVNTRPSHIVRIGGTFSKMKYAGCFASSIRESSKKRVPRGSSKALLAPAALKATHGKPPTRRSKSGISSVLTALASLQKYSPFVGCKVRQAATAVGSLSQ